MLVWSCAPAAGVLSCDHGRHHPVPAAGRSPRRAGRDRAPGAVAVYGDHRPREPGPAQSRRDEGRRAPGVVGVDGLDHDLAVVRAPAGPGPGVGQAARLARAARDQLPAGRAGGVVPADAAGVRRLAELSQPGQGPRPGRLLDRLGRHRRDRADLGHGGPPLPGQPLPGDRKPRPPVLAAGRRRARRGRGVGGRRRSRRGRAGRGRLGRGREPAVAGPRGAPDHRRPAARHVHRGRAGRSSR